MVENVIELQDLCLKVFHSVSHICSIFVLPLFMAKVVYHSVLGEGSKTLSHLKGVVCYFLLVAVFPLILEVILSIPESFLPKFDGVNKYLLENQVSPNAGAIPFVLDRAMEAILAVLYWVVYYLHIFFLILMSAMGPVVFLLSSVLGIGLGVEIFLGMLVVGSSWPIIWYGFDQVHMGLTHAQGDAFGAKCLELLITLLKGIAPISFSALAIKSPAGRAVSQTAGMIISSSKIPMGFAKGSVSRVINKNETKNMQNNTRLGDRTTTAQNVRTKGYSNRSSIGPLILRQREKNENTFKRDI